MVVVVVGARVVVLVVLLVLVVVVVVTPLQAVTAPMIPFAATNTAYLVDPPNCINLMPEIPGVYSVPAPVVDELYN